jgi:hypothetical protein
MECLAKVMEDGRVRCPCCRADFDRDHYRFPDVEDEEEKRRWEQAPAFARPDWLHAMGSYLAGKGWERKYLPPALYQIL